ncbi:hypothetical protein INR49_005679 [Caranx melampygus]|nr:hypothetical protein INR49_005679 [Caranx melampygus]
MWHGFKNWKGNMLDESNRSVLVYPGKFECVARHTVFKMEEKPVICSHSTAPSSSWCEESINLVRQKSPLLVMCHCHTHCSFSTCLTCRANFSSCH